MHDPSPDFRAAMLAKLGHVPEVIEPGRLHRFATADKRGDKAGWCKLFPDLRGGVFGCYRQGISDTWCAQDRAAMSRAERADLARQVEAATKEREQQRREAWKINALRNAHVWANCRPLVPGDAATLYLKGRGLGGVWPLPEGLRFHPALEYWEGGRLLGTHPAMVAALTACDGQMLALHRTYLTRAGRKAEVPTVKKLTGASGPLAGACIRLFGPERGCMGIAEGIETAFCAWRMSGVPTVAAYCAHNLAAWVWPAGVQRLVIFADADETGREAADTLRARAIGAGLRVRVRVMMPSADGADWADVWAGRDVVPIEAGDAA
jgi:putative DNA primase/helicase